MEFITEISVDDRERWNRTVRSFPDYEVFYLNEYVVAFMQESEKNGIPLLLLYEKENDRAVNVVFRRDIGKDDNLHGLVEENIFYDLISPYGYGGFMGKVSDYNALNAAYYQYCKNRNYVCEFVRFLLFDEYCHHYDGYVESRSHNVVRSLDVTPDDMWMDFKPKVRKNVKKAARNDLKIIIENTGEYLKDFLEIYYSTMDRCDAEKEYFFSRQFFDELNQMRENIMYFHVVYEGKIISTELVIYGAKNCYSYLGGTYREYFDVRPNDFLKYEIIKWAQEKGLTNFVLGGGYGSDDGIFQYKLGLAPHGVVDFHIGKKIFDRDVYLRLCDLRKIDISAENMLDGFFPAYRRG